MTTQNSPTINPATVHEILANQRRARIIEYLTTVDRSKVSIEAIVDQLTDEDDVGRAVRMTLRHHHLPYLADICVVEFEPEIGLVRPTLLCETVYQAQKEMAAVLGG